MKGLTIKLLFFINHIVAILFLCFTASEPSVLSLQTIVPLLLATFFLGDISYIISCNIRENKILNLFGGLLAAESWYLLSASAAGADFFFLLLSPMIVLVSVKFCFLFVFQGYAYKYQRITDRLMVILCMGTFLSIFVSPTLYAGMFGLQFVLSFFCFLFLIIYHRKRVLFILKNERKAIAFSMALTLLLFGAYYAMTMGMEDPIGNFGMYIVVCIFSMSVHGIAFKESHGLPFTSIFSRKQLIAFLFLGMALLSIAVISLKLTLTVFIILVNVLSCLIFLGNIMLADNLKKERSSITQNSKYLFALQQLQREEELKNEFADFLHDEVLQDLLSVKNMTGKSSRPDVQEIMYETLDSLNIHIRNQMQDYHPVLLKSLTLKENLEHLIFSLSETFKMRTIKVSFECLDHLFIAEPYDLLVYRWIKELLTNVFKHSDGSHAWIALSEEKNRLQLTICDNGTRSLSASKIEELKHTKHKGLVSIAEQVEKLNGNISFSKNIPQGVCIEIEILMKGEDSYKHFIGG